jgi:hypothetical protein
MNKRTKYDTLEDLRGPRYFRWYCGVPVWDKDGEFVEFKEEFTGMIKTTARDKDVIENLCADDFKLNQYGSPNHNSDDDCEAILDTLYFEEC